jgi:hypothetical protein
MMSDAPTSELDGDREPGALAVATTPPPVLPDVFRARQHKLVDVRAHIRHL